MKKNWFWPVVLIIVILGLIVISGIYMALRTINANNTLDIDERMKNHVITVDGTARQKLGFYYLTGSLKEPVLMHVQTGDTVQKDDPLFTYVDQKLNNEETEIELQLDNKRVEKEQVEGQIAAYEDRRLDADFEETATIDAQLNWLDSELTKADNNISILEEKQKKIVKKIDELTVKAGADGEVLAVDDEQVQAFTSDRQDQPVVTLSVDTLHIDGAANRYEMQFLEPNLKLKAVSPEVDDHIYKGQLESISKTPIEHLETGKLTETAHDESVEPVTEEPTTEEPEDKPISNTKFQYTGFLSKSTNLVDGDEMNVKIYPSFKDHIWLPERFVKKEVVTKDKGKKLTVPITKYYVQKVYGEETNKELVTIKKHVGGQYLVTKGLSSIDKISAFDR
ncbi:hypothetical protein [Macrococcus lamae]|uniref:YknX-like barrel-sandwich hybrid domain-containing protein n=1 Tax=Macrococcus lamae TaxID=198484 RepID=A0A4R6BT95_9STAP|nr:hypothetical protein [Macrococcus lamae]TDM07872.1 hypothetical protein ERX29_07410 [Macrococcus lamae]